MTLHLIHLPVPPRAFAEWARGRGFGPKGTQDDGMTLHILLSALFGKGVLQPFRLFAPDRGDGSLYAYAAQSTPELAETARMVGTPEMLAAVALDRMRGKPMPEPRAGQRLGFDLRFRPVRRLTEGGRVRERDAFVAEACRDHPDDPHGMTAAGRDREAVYRDWLAERLAGAELDAAELVRFQRLRVLRDGRALEGPDATMHGTLTVTDPAAFSGALASGIGRHRAYGFGMLLLRPPGAPVPER
ncbi:CRISPR system Cascade subunit CasE [Paracoccus pantotrophus]|nr:CRISPR system Cascade subunit CasE [Paracoccus pantotrophus]